MHNSFRYGTYMTTYVSMGLFLSELNMEDFKELYMCTTVQMADSSQIITITNNSDY